VGRHVTLAIDVYVWIVDVEAGCDVVFDALDDLSIEFVVVDWSREAMKVWYEHIDIAVCGMLVSEIDHRFIGTKKIANCWLFVRSDPC
jgi:hypothetical protein